MTIITDANRVPISQSLDEILHYVWDPIGIAGQSGMRNEYHTYATHAYALLKNNATSDEIRRYLTMIEREQMENSITEQKIEHIDFVVRLLVDAREWFIHHSSLED